MNLALFDFDGTLTHQDSFSRFMHYAVPWPRKLRYALPLLGSQLGYKMGLLAPKQGRANAVYFGLKGMDSEHYCRLGQHFATTVIPALLRNDTLTRLRWHQAQGDTVVVVSASLNTYLAPWCAEMGVMLLCAELAIQQQRLTGQHLGADCCNAEKARRIQEQFNLADYERIYAYGDTTEDTEMLALATDPYWISPSTIHSFT